MSESGKSSLEGLPPCYSVFKQTVPVNNPEADSRVEFLRAISDEQCDLILATEDPNETLDLIFKHFFTKNPGIALTSDDWVDIIRELRGEGFDNIGGLSNAEWRYNGIKMATPAGDFHMSLQDLDYYDNERGYKLQVLPRIELDIDEYTVKINGVSYKISIHDEIWLATKNGRLMIKEIVHECEDHKIESVSINEDFENIHFSPIRKVDNETK